MGTTTIMMIGYLHSQAEYRDQEKILRTLTAVAEQGYLITTLEETSHSLEAQRPHQAGISPRLYPHLEAYFSGKEADLSTEAHAVDTEGPRQGFSYGCLSLSAPDEMLVVNVDDWHFSLHSGARADSRYPEWKGGEIGRASCRE